ncbi:hypothetical protein NUH30_00460 [Leptospira sp. 85282-16]|uniref:SH3 domain-containing protein n=1 Tax=Leptospira montravelensis TaxID=2484961 RepID=A0ABY2LT22_9LEPT|nr:MULTISPECIES: hypothetical protein [Leptospira]MCT8332132.1 hypothetical protein [Leptospira sp. 85282-16]TGK83369.1 hypothetical protein EHQ19_02215 [Leptospira montravelensis]TGL05371.1 hypothetical protein EHQ31_01250 [Leptospira montravelensis]
MNRNLLLILGIVFLTFSSLVSKPTRELRIVIDAEADANFELELWQEKPNESGDTIAPKPPESILFKGNRITVTPKDNFEYFRVRRLGEYGAKGFWTQVYSTNVDPGSPLSVPKEFVAKKTFVPQAEPKKVVSVVSTDSFIIVKEKEESVRYLTKNQLTLNPSDDASGIAEVRYKLGNSHWNSAKTLTSIPVQEEGNYKFLYFSLDQAGNKEPMQVLDFIKDVSPPETKMEWVGPNSLGKGKNLYISQETKIKLTTKDRLSGPKDILVAYTCQSGTQTEFKPYNAEISIFDLKSVCKGSFQLFYYAVDRVGNEEAVKTLNFQLGSESN